MPMHTIDFDHMKLKAGDRLLDIGCGEGRHSITAYVLADVTSVGVDLNLHDLLTTRERFRDFEDPHNTARQLLLSVADATRLPFADQSFEKIICSEVLEHIPDYRAVLREIERILKPGGIFAVSVPRFFPEWVCWKLSKAYHSVAGGHIRIFRRSVLHREVARLNLIFFNHHWAHALHVPYWWMKCLLWRDGEEENLGIIKQYRRFLEWDLLKAPLITRLLEKTLNPVLGKSLVLYYVKNI